MRNSRKRRDEALKKQGVPLLVRISNEKISQMRPIVGEFIEEFYDYAERVKSGEDPELVWDTLPRRIKQQIGMHAVATP
jgi:hypothetical protein